MSDAEDEDDDNSDIEVDEDAGDSGEGYHSEDSSGHNTSSEVEIGDVKSDDKYVDSNDNDSQTIEVDD